MNKHLLIAYSWSFSNIGDIGITPGLINLIRKQKPELPIKIIANQREGDGQYALVNAYYKEHDLDCEINPNFIRPLINGAIDRLKKRWGAQKIEHFVKGCLPSSESADIVNDILERVPAEIHDDLKRNQPRMAAIFDDAGFVLYNSGTTLNFGRLGKRDLSVLAYAMPMLISRKCGIPYGINAQSFEAVDWPIDLVYRTLFGDACFLYCRDSDSLNYLRQRGITNMHSGFRPDSTFFFRIFDEAWADQFLQDNKLQSKQFISIITRISDTPGNDVTIGGAVSPERTVAHMQKLKEFIEQWVSQTGMKILLCHETRHSVTSMKEHLWSILPEETRQNCVYLDHFWTPEQAYSVLKRTRILVSMEMHSTIMSINIGTPVIHNPYAEAGRKREMIRDIGIGDWLVDIDCTSAQEMLAIALAIHRNYEVSEQRIRDLLPGLEARANATLSEVWSKWKK